MYQREIRNVAGVVLCTSCGWLALSGHVAIRDQAWAKTAADGWICGWCRRRARVLGKADPAQTEIRW